MFTMMTIIAAMAVSAGVVAIALRRSFQPARSMTQILTDLESETRR